VKRLLPALVGTVALCSLMVLVALDGAFLSLPIRGKLWDLGDFILAGRAASLGLDPYTLDPALLGEWGGAFNPGSRNVNPPASLLLFGPLAWFDPGALLWGLYALSLLAYAAAVILLARAYPASRTVPRTIWAFCLAGLWHTLFLSQIYALIALGLAAAWLLVTRGRLGWAGLVLGVLAALKPYLLVIPGLLLLARHWRPALASFGAFGVLSALPVLLYGPDVYGQWFVVLPSGGETALVVNASLVAEFSRLGATWLGYALSIAVLGALVPWALLSKPAPLPIMALGLVASILAGPTGYIELGILLLPVFLSRPRWSPALLAAAALMLVPHQVIWGWSLAGPQEMILAGSVHFAAYCLVLGTLAVESLREPLRSSVSVLSWASLMMGTWRKRWTIS
jgi:hypothetical protein